jgi:hypothetical protein
MKPNATSAKVARQARYEWELDHTILNVVFSAGSAEEFGEAVRSTVYADQRYARLPKYRQIACEAYARGALDALARVAAGDAPKLKLKLKTAPARRGKNGRRSEPPALHPSPKAPTFPLPEWVRPQHPQPFPLAKDFLL